MKTRVLMDALEKLAPHNYAESWDNVGLLVGRPEREVRKVYLALDADGHAVEEAVGQGCDMIVTHHPLLFSAIKSVREEDFIGRRLLMMIENNINYYAMHTNYDVAVMADLAADRLGITDREPLDAVRETEEGLKGIGCTGCLPKAMTLSELASYIKTQFDLPQVRYYGEGDCMVHRVSMCPGSGKGMDREALQAGAQVFITGDVDHHFGIDCVEKGLCVIDAGHHGLEHLFVDYMREWFSKNYPELEVVTDRNESPFGVV